MGGRAFLSAIALATSLDWALADDASLSRRLRPVESQVCEYSEHHAPDGLRRLLSLYPRGGDGLALAVYSAVVETPATARYVVVIANRANPDQITAIVRGLLQALERLDTFGPQCQHACPNQGDAWRNSVADSGILQTEALQNDAERRLANDGRFATAGKGDQCGAPIRAAMLCAEPTVDAVMTALAAQGFAVGDASAAGHCNAPIYAGGHNFSGWSISASPAVSRN